MKNQKNSKNSKVDNIIIALILIFTLVFIMYSLIGNRKENLGIPEKEFKTDKIQISFNKFKTTEDEYNTLKSKCIEYIENTSNIEIDLDSSIRITDNIYIDINKSNSSIKNNGELQSMYETGPIYLNDKVLFRYVTEQGKMTAVASKVIKDTRANFSGEQEKSYITVGIEDFQTIFDNTYIDNKNVLNYGMIDEQEYLKNISEILVNMIEIDNEEDPNKVVKYFTYDGYITTKQSINNLKSEIAIERFIEAGKSSLNSEYNDRIIAQIETEKGYITIVVKLNNEQKIFDIDII